MSEQFYDVIIVGAGIAGSSAAITAASAGLDVLLLEQADTPGKMNMTGGRIYTRALKKLLPDFASTAPLQRTVTNERVSVLTEEAASTLEYFNALAGSADEASASSTVLRKSFDAWLAHEAEKAGAKLRVSQRVIDLIKNNDTVCGVKTGTDTFNAHVIILAEGASSLLGQKVGLVKKHDPAKYATGAKEVIHLGAEVVDERFNCKGGTGVAWLFLGYPSTGQMGGGFLYTNKDSISLGMVVGMKDARESNTSVLQMLADFKKHPLIEPLIKDGEVIARGGHMVPEGGYNAIPELADNGLLIVGDAASLCLNLGYTIRGMDLAILSGIAAANTAIRAKKADNYSRDYLWSYYDELEKENIFPDMRHYKHIPEFLHNERIFTTYPKLVNNFMQEIFTVDSGSEPAWKKISRYVQRAGILHIIKDVWQGIKSF
ncbi:MULTISPECIES: FAD-dependent oxidoreductase [unclassified Desulfovibrio]|uniref:FAD-dependent oxidoreductase n=1 Tax=unclassified Desulfovibrio TaxID=2593640 RepID=UPI0013EAB0F7|nr:MULTISPECIES: FAD-dependent oxidoreductase [unclassified Desulfovibrio]